VSHSPDHLINCSPAPHLASSASAGGKMRVLIVDDDSELANLLKMSLQFGFYEKGKRLARSGRRLTEGLEVEHVSDTAEALKKLAAAPDRIDLIFTDIHSGSMDGYEFMEACRARHRDKYGEIIIVTERGNKEEVKRGILAGAKDYVLKPFTPQELMEHVFDAWSEPSERATPRKHRDHPEAR
jgi:two-component system, chemotaxis family, chemotaxis protein CheY